MLFASNTEKPGLKIIKTPIKPIKTASHVFIETFSFKIITDKITISTGANDPTLCTSASCKYLKDNIKNIDSKIDRTLLNICFLILLLFQNNLFFILFDSIRDKNNKNKYLNNKS